MHCEISENILGEEGVEHVYALDFALSYLNLSRIQPA